VGQGSIFHFDIPVRPVATPIPTTLERSAIRSLADLRILIVDDNATNRWILQMQAESWGMVPVIAPSSTAALKLVQEGERFDVAILDVMMPGLDGYELASEIRKVRSEHELPILLLTSISDRGPRLADLGIAGLLTKPVKISPLFNALRQVLGGTRDFPSPRDKETPGTLLGDAWPLKILVAEDNAVNQRVTDLMLKRLGFQSAIVANGLEALDILQKETFDVVFLDVQMPEMDGLEAAKEICRTYPGESKPWLIALTAHAVEGDKDDCLAAGMDDYVSKPVRSESLDAALRRAIDHINDKATD
jgi:CheY-like chemotaxis protein